MRLYVLLKKQEENYLHNMKEWVEREASNQDALQEAGTFRYCDLKKPGRSALWQPGLQLLLVPSPQPRKEGQNVCLSKGVICSCNEQKIVWVVVTWGFAISFLFFCVCLNFFIKNNKKNRTSFLVGYKC